MKKKKIGPNLTVITGGHKPVPEKESVRDKFVNDHLFMVLPAPTRADIADRLSARVGRPVSVPMVGQYIDHTRTFRDRLGWTVHHAKRGINSAGTNQFHALLINADGTFITDMERDQCDQGAASTLRYLITMLDNSMSMTAAIAAHSSSPIDKRVYRSLTRGLRQTRELAEELMEEYA